SGSFTEAWAAMRSLRLGGILPSTAKQLLANNPWTAHVPLDDLVAACLKAVSTRILRSREESEAKAYTYLDSPLLSWAGSNPKFIYELQPRSPAWVEVERLVFVSSDLVRKEAVLIKDGSWRFEYDPISIELTNYPRESFSFDLQLRGISLLPETINVSLVP